MRVFKHRNKAEKRPQGLASEEAILEILSGAQEAQSGEFPGWAYERNIVLMIYKTHNGGSARAVRRYLRKLKRYGVVQRKQKDYVVMWRLSQLD